MTNSSISAPYCPLIPAPDSALSPNPRFSDARFSNRVAVALIAAVAVTAPAAHAQSANAQAAPTIAPTLAAKPANDNPTATAMKAIAAALRKGDRTGALKLADAFLATHHRNLSVRFQRAVILEDLNRLPEAAAGFESLIQDFPELPEPYNDLAVIHAVQGHLELAEQDLRRSIGAQPNYVTARENLGDLYIAMAVASYASGVKLAPADAALRKKLAMARSLSTELTKAR